MSYWLPLRDPHPPLPSVSSSGDTLEDWERATTCWRERGGRSQIRRQRESLVLYKSFNTLRLPPYPPGSLSTLTIHVKTNPNLPPPPKSLFLSVIAYPPPIWPPFTQQIPQSSFRSTSLVFRHFQKEGVANVIIIKWLLFPLLTNIYSLLARSQEIFSAATIQI